MSGHWKFMHAADFRLGTPVRSPRCLSEELAERLVQAPYRAVERLVDIACRQAPHGVLLSGNLLDPRTCGAYALAFLTRQFERLAEAGIQVYWALGEDDRAAHWGDMPDWPQNVTLFDSVSWERHTLTDGSQQIDIVGRSWDEASPTHDRVWPAPTDADTPLVAVAALQPNAHPGSAQGAYWALGGSDTPLDLHLDEPVVHYSGSVQPRDVFATRRGSATWVEVSYAGSVQWEAIPLAGVVGIKQTLDASQLDGDATLADVLEMVIQDADSRHGDTSAADESIELRLVRYTLDGLPPHLAWQVMDPTEQERAVRHITEHLRTHRMAIVSLVPQAEIQTEEHIGDGTVLSDLLQTLTDPTTTPTHILAERALPRWLSEQHIPTDDIILSHAQIWSLANLRSPSPREDFRS